MHCVGQHALEECPSVEGKLRKRLKTSHYRWRSNAHFKGGCSSRGGCKNYKNDYHGYNNTHSNHDDDHTNNSNGNGGNNNGNNNRRDG